MAQGNGEFAGKAALVTGGSSGIGRATVETLARRGAAVAFCADEADAVAQTEAELAGSGLAVIGIVADVASSADADRFVTEAASRLGGVALLANCAGIRRAGTVADLDEADWDRVMAVNVKGIYCVARAAIPHMREAGGAIVNVSSTQAYVCRPRGAAYIASKGAINALTRSMALDHAAERIRVNTVCPGLVDTRLVREGLAQAAGFRSAAELLAERVAAHPLGAALGRPCTAEEVAEVIAFLLSDRASFVSGSAYTVDGALTVQALG